MGVTVQPKSSSIAADVCVAQAGFDLVNGVIDVSCRPRGEPILGTGVEVTKENWRQTRDGIVKMCCPVLSASLIGDVFDKSKVADPGRAISVEIASVTLQ